MDSITPLRILALTHTSVSESCTFVRMLTPLQSLQDKGQVEYDLRHLMPWNVAAIRDTIRTLDKWDILWISRPRHYFMLPIIKAARHLGKPVLVDIDDWLLDVPIGHVDADFYRTRPRRETIRVALRAADCITTSTQVIAEYCMALGVRVHVLPNAVDCQQFTKESRREGPLTIAFCGTPSHHEDVPLIASGLQQALHDHAGKVRVVTVGCLIPGLQGQAGYTHHDFVVATEYPRLLSDLRIDIGLAPLQDTPFNRAKSDVKYLEYSATGAATIASPVAPYQSTIREDCGLIVDANTTEAWSTAISCLIDQDERRQRLASNAYEWVRDERSVDAAANKWHKLFRSYADDPTPQTSPGVNQLTSGRFERMMVNIAIRQTPYDAQQLLSRLTQKASRLLRA